MDSQTYINTEFKGSLKYRSEISQAQLKRIMVLHIIFMYVLKICSL